MPSKWDPMMKMALNAAEKFAGATAPNPPAGAIAVDKNGKVLIGAAHMRAGEAYAEAKVLELAGKLGKLAAIETLVVTSEPHAEPILKHKQIRRVVFGTANPDPKTATNDRECLKAAGLELVEGVLEEECKFLIRAFAKWSRAQIPYVTLVSETDESGAEKSSAAIPSPVVHELRRRADAIWTGSGTILDDAPDFSVTLVPDHPQKKRPLMISDRRRRVPEVFLDRARKQGFMPLFAENFTAGLQELGKKNCLEVLVQAGPELTDAWLKSGLWDEHVVISQSETGEEIETEFREG